MQVGAAKSVLALIAGMLINDNASTGGSDLTVCNPGSILLGPNAGEGATACALSLKIKNFSRPVRCSPTLSEGNDSVICHGSPSEPFCMGAECSQTSSIGSEICVFWVVIQGLHCVRSLGRWLGGVWWGAGPPQSGHWDRELAEGANRKKSQLLAMKKNSLHYKRLMTGPRPATRQHRAPTAYLSADRSPGAGRPALPVVQPFEIKKILVRPFAAL